MSETNLGDLEVPEGVDAEKAQRLINRIVKLEAENDKTNKLNQREMVDKIHGMIQSDVKCI